MITTKELGGKIYQIVYRDGTIGEPLTWENVLFHLILSKWLPLPLEAVRVVDVRVRPMTTVSVQVDREIEEARVMGHRDIVIRVSEFAIPGSPAVLSDTVSPRHSAQLSIHPDDVRILTAEHWHYVSPDEMPETTPKLETLYGCRVEYGEIA